MGCFLIIINCAHTSRIFRLQLLYSVSIYNQIFALRQNSGVYERISEYLPNHGKNFSSRIEGIPAPVPGDNGNEHWDFGTETEQKADGKADEGFLQRSP